MVVGTRFFAHGVADTATWCAENVDRPPLTRLASGACSPSSMILVVKFVNYLG